MLQLDRNRFRSVHVLVIGDVMLDAYYWGNVKRISPEAPVPVFHTRTRSEVLGGAGNVINNLTSLECKATALGICGNDEAGNRLKNLLDRKGIQDQVLRDSSRPTITKTRVLSSGQQLLRIDDEEVFPLDQAVAKDLLGSVHELILKCNAVILSDYGKGTLSSLKLVQTIIELSKSQKLPVIIDPKGADWSRYEGATCITPNTNELELVYGASIKDEEQLVGAMQDIKSRYRLNCLLTTRGPLGMCFLPANNKPAFIPSLAREVYDVSGAGDTVIATFSLGVASGMSFVDAARLANVAAGIVVGKLGTQPVALSELESSLARTQGNSSGHFSRKVSSLSAARLQIKAWRANGETIVFTNGCFDLLHPGHIHLLNTAKNLGNRLVVGLNSDASVQRLKGDNRPILSEHDRASMLGALDSVDLAIVFDEDTPEKLIGALKPDILIKGKDYMIGEVVGKEIVESYGGHVTLIDLLDGYSTTNIAGKVGKGFLRNNPTHTELPPKN